MYEPAANQMAAQMHMNSMGTPMYNTPQPYMGMQPAYYGAPMMQQRPTFISINKHNNN
jgi:hypothetical protein